MGVPTANILPSAEGLEGCPQGVYFGWAQLQRPEDQVAPMVMNYGQRPSIDDGADATVSINACCADACVARQSAGLAAGYASARAMLGALCLRVSVTMHAG
jgi:hypothetical protein